MHIAVLDIGTGGFHAALYTAGGELLTDGYQAISYRGGRRSRNLEFDAEELFLRGMRLLASLIVRVPGIRDRKLVLAVTSQRHGSVFFDDAMRPLLAAANLDGRVDSACLEEIRPYSDEIFALSGRLPSEIFPALRLRLLARRNPELYSRITSFLMINEYFAYRLTGLIRAEKTSSSESMLYDIRDNRWSERLGEIFGIQGLNLPPVVEPGSIIGPVLPEHAEGFSLPRGTVVSLGAGDTQCAAAGSGAFEAGEAAAVNGSTTPVVMVSDNLVFDPLRRTWADHYVDGKYLIESNAGCTGMAYRGISRMLPSCDTPEPGPDAVLDADRLGLSAHLVPDPWKPIDFLNTPSRIEFLCDPAEMLGMLPYLMIENTAFAVAANIEELKRVSGHEVRRVFLTGGGSRSPWTQRILGVLLEDSPVYLTSNLDTTSRGAAMLALAAARGGSARVRDNFGENPAAAELRPDMVKPDIAQRIRGRYHQWCEGFHNGTQ